MIQLRGPWASPIPSLLYSGDELLCAASAWEFQRKPRPKDL